MSKSFFEVFPALDLEQDLREQFSVCSVERVTASKFGNRLYLYLTSPKLIRKQDIRQVEKALDNQVFLDAKKQVEIRERFVLEKPYTPEEIMTLYENSFRAELKTDQPVLHAVYREADIAYDADGQVCLTLPDGIIERENAPRLKDRLENVLCKRCGVQASVSVAFTERRQNGLMTDDRETVTDRREKPETVASAGSTGKSAPVSAPPRTPGSTAATEGRPAQYAKNKKRDSHPDLIFGRVFRDQPVPVETIDIEDGSTVAIEGRILSFEERALKTGRHVVLFALYDKTDSMTVKLFTDEEDALYLKEQLTPGEYVRVLGKAKDDDYEHELVLFNPTGIMKSEKREKARGDDAPVKRAELHMHTQMSDMDAVSAVKDIVKRAYGWGWPGIAITDHAVVQALTDAGHVWEELYGKACEAAKEAEQEAPDRQDFFKLIPGAECYVVDDEKKIVENSRGQAVATGTYVVFDLETTGFSPHKNRIIEIGAVRIENGKITDRFSEFVNPGRPIPYRITELTGIDDAMVADAKKIEDVLPRFTAFCEGAVLVGHNVAFDIAFINENCARQGIEADYTTVDTVGLSRAFFPKQARHTLDAVAKTLHVTLDQHHRAVDDAEATAGIFLKFMAMLAEKEADTLDDVNRVGVLSPDAAKHLRPHHLTLLAKNTLGRVNLYTLISESHLNYFYRYPLVPKSLLRKYREGLLIGSADAHGELWEAVAEGRSADEIARIVSFCDFLEVQPEENAAYMIEHRRYENINSTEDIRAATERIVRLGEQFGKPVCATSDAHFLDPDDALFRTVLVDGKDIKGGKNAKTEQKGVKKDDDDAPLYLRTTGEMMEAFRFLGEDKAREIVIDNPRRILDYCDSVSPVRPDKCPPVIADSDKTLRRICYEKMHALYGNPLPEIVETRLEKELTSIINNGFAVMYIIAQKLVWKSLEDGYIVGSRGSVGSSFVAFAADITEVNALPPHYVCPSCQYSDFDSDEVLSYAGGSGCDMPDRMCPRCGHKLNKDGFDIPFETFLGFEGEKEPDIDLNFSPEYQAIAHKYTEEIFGKGQTYRAGTVSGLQDKTAYGVVRKYLDYFHINRRRAEVDRIVQGLSGVRHGTGQHPGGIIVLPVGEDINSFTPVQHPANKSDSDTITTHYDYHSIEHNLLKLDILGHDDPTMVRFLFDATGLDPTKVPLDDPAVMQLFIDTSSLGIEPSQIGGTKLGCLGLPEFGTDFAMQMVIEAKPTSFSHLIRITGLAHGTDVWLGNARDLILNGTATIDTAICNRDDIMNYLIGKGVDPLLSFDTMEKVRKGKGLTDEMKTAMLNANVSEWYIDSCIKIKYMFPKAHATAYVMNAWRLAWFKVHEPLAFYAAWFSIRAKQLSYDRMFRGKDVLYKAMEEIRNIEGEPTDAQKNELYAMRIAQEMYERGFSCMPVDIFRAKAEKFQVIDGKLMPSLVSIDGMGPVAAGAIEEAVKEGAFLSRDDFRERTKCPQAVVDWMAEEGLLGDIPISNQMSLFDMLTAKKSQA